jgi:alginate O-acetyltransferase complex protein AlgI
MFFNSLTFAIFLPIVFFLHWFVFNKTKSTQNALLIAASYYFYSCWDWRFLFLLVFSTFLDYYTGIQIEKSIKNKGRKFWFWLSIGINLGFLGIFKYYNFFSASFAQMLTSVGFKASPILLDVILPVGISFYTFHGLSYVIDIYYKRIKAEYNFVDYSLFVSYFPLLVAGPIERATHLLPQIKIKRDFDYNKMIDGLRQILWGLFKKMVIADNCARYVNIMFADTEQQSGSSLALGAVLFAFQIYGDFSGYSDIALGVSRLLGIELLKNFNFPYFSRDIAEFWRRWHISLTSWFRDYLYIPLGGSKVDLKTKIRNTFIVFCVSGFWHGANWTFIVWGLLNAFYFLPLLIIKKNRKNIEIVAKGKILPTYRDFISIILTFSLTTFAWIFFRADTVVRAIDYIERIFTKSFFTIPQQIPTFEIVFLLIFLVIEWFGRESNYGLEKIGLNRPILFRWLLYYALIFMILYMGGSEQKFIYFQF